MSWPDAFQSIGLVVGGGLVGAAAPVVADYFAWKRDKADKLALSAHERDVATRQFMREFRVTATHAVVAANQFATELFDAMSAEPKVKDPWPSPATCIAWRDAYLAFVLASEDLRADVHLAPTVASVDELINLLREANDLTTRAVDEAKGDFDTKDSFDELSQKVREGLRTVAGTVQIEIDSRQSVAA